MPTIYVKFVNHPKLILDINDTVLGHRYYNLVKEQNSIEPPMFRDRATYGMAYLRELIKETNRVVGTNWETTNIDKPTLVGMHKLVEELVGTNTSGFSNVDSSLDNLLHELHFCIHAVDGSAPENNIRSTWMQLEWFNDSGFDLPDDFTFSKRLLTGDLRLQNPYVGHPPFRVYADNDYTKVSQTCRFHDFVRPGIVMSIQDFNVEYTNSEEYINWFNTHAPDFVAQHGMDKILHYSGHPVIGKVRNIDDLIVIKNSWPLTFESLTFVD